jgi:hypothetical protein
MCPTPPPSTIQTTHRKQPFSRPPGGYENRHRPFYGAPRPVTMRAGRHHPCSSEHRAAAQHHQPTSTCPQVVASSDRHRVPSTILLLLQLCRDGWPCTMQHIERDRRFPSSPETLLIKNGAAWRAPDVSGAKGAHRSRLALSAGGGRGGLLVFRGVQDPVRRNCLSARIWATGRYTTL